MRVKQPADYTRYRIDAAEGLPATTVSMSWEQRLKGTRRAGGVKQFSKLVRAEAARLRHEGHPGKLSAAVRRAVQDRLQNL